MRLLQNPNVAMCDDAEVISYLISKVAPLFWDDLSHKVQDCVGEVFLRWIVPIMGNVAVHDGPEPFDHCLAGHVHMSEKGD